MPEPRKRLLNHKLPPPLAMALYRPSVKAALLLNPSSRRTHLRHRRPVKWRSFLHPPKLQLQLQPPLQRLLSTPAKRRRPQRSRPVPLRSPRNPPQRSLGNARPPRLAEKARRRPEQKLTDQPKSGWPLEKRPTPLERMETRGRTRPKVVGPCAQGKGGRERRKRRHELGPAQTRRERAMQMRPNPRMKNPSKKLPLSAQRDVVDGLRHPRMHKR